MLIIKDQTDYIQRRLAGEDVIPRAYLYGLIAVEKEQSADEVMVISISHLDFSVYIYEIKNGDFKVASFQENANHSLSEAITEDVLDEQTQAWWKAVFYEIDGRCTFDPAYASFKVAENRSQTFQEMIQSVILSLNQMKLTRVPPTVCIVGEYSSNPLVRYVIQQELSAHNDSIKLIPCEDIKSDSFEGSQNRIVYSTERIQALPMQVNKALYLNEILQQPMTITFPLQCIDNVLVDGVVWSQLVSDNSPDYSVGNYEFKHLILQAECDVYGFIFLSCSDVHNNRKIVKL